ncbi:MAG: chromate resistance protein [Proteobacteria bacterium]|nr:chromate resistance protein [Pseudomonadota bacterium]
MATAKASRPDTQRWLILTHQLPPDPAYQRVRIWRRLQAIGAVGVKKSVYALPHSDDTLEDFLWIAKEVEAAGGEALVSEARLLHGVTDEELRARFDAARESDYADLGSEARAIRNRLRPTRQDGEPLAGLESAARRLRRRFAEVAEIDFFGANARESTDALIRELEAGVAALRVQAPVDATPAGPVRRSALRGRTWVTRRGVKIDRVACAWLIRRFIDRKARFRFVDPATYRPATGDVRYDMAAAEFTHRGDRCSFEVLVDEFGIDDPALGAIGEIVHDLDLKDGRFGRPESEGVRQFVGGLVLSTDDDEQRIREASVLFDNLYRSLGRKPVRMRARR